MIRGLIAAILAVVLIITAGVGIALYRGYDGLFGGPDDPRTLVTTSLEGLKRQNRLIVLTARYVSVVSSSQTRMFLEAEKTLIMPGTVRYELDLSKLDEDDLDWNAETRELQVTLPPIEVTGPEIDQSQVREFREGTLVMALTDAEEVLDEANRKAARQDIVAQAKGETPMELARSAARQAIQASFALPLSAAGLDARVTARFATSLPAG